MISEQLKGKRVGCYCRVSSEEQKKNITIGSQREAVMKRARESEAAEIILYEDEGYSGSTLARPALDRLRDDVHTGKLDVILVNDVDRLCRDVEKLLFVKRDIESCGIRLLFVNAPIEDSPSGGLHLNMLASFAEYERLVITDRMRRGKRSKAEHKKLFVGHVPRYGYKYMHKDRRPGFMTEGFLVPINSELRIVRKMFDWILAGGSVGDVCRNLMNDNIPAPKGGKRWGRSTVSRILKDEIYAGTYHYGRTVTVVKHNGNINEDEKKGRKARPATEWVPVKMPDELSIITPDEFRRTRRQIELNSSLKGRNNTKNEYLVKGLIRCGICGCTWCGNVVHGGTYYRDTNRQKTFPNPPTCRAGMIKSQTLDDLVWKTVSEIVTNPSVVMNQIKRKRAEYEKQPHERQEAEDLLKELSDLSKEEERLLEAYQVGAINLAQLQTKMPEIKRKMGLVQKSVDDCSEQGNNKVPLIKLQRSIKQWCQDIKQRLGKMTFEERQTLVQHLLDGVIMDKESVLIKFLLPLKQDEENYFRRADRAATVQSQDVLRSQYYGGGVN